MINIIKKYINTGLIIIFGSAIVYGLFNLKINISNTNYQTQNQDQSQSQNTYVYQNQVFGDKEKKIIKISGPARWLMCDDKILNSKLKDIHEKYDVNFVFRDDYNWCTYIVGYSVHKNKQTD